MYFCMCFCSALFIAVAISENVTLPDVYETKKNSSDSTKTGVTNNTIITIVSEGGGTLLPNIPDLSSPKDKLNSLITLDEELSKTKEKAVVPRKGVNMQIDEKKALQTESENKLDLLPETLTSSTTTKIPTTTNKLTNININATLPNSKTYENKLENTTTAPKKPLLLSYEALANKEKQIRSDSSNIPIAPSTKTISANQIPSPSSPNNDIIKKVYPSKATNSHPGMIMPIVITILVVPMFAIVGYFALKRGQEAWKNRHYKRMDFLLDGMYND